MLGIQGFGLRWACRFYVVFPVFVCVSFPKANAISGGLQAGYVVLSSRDISLR